jgi:uncharacterized iron-regulated protein
MLHGKEAVMFSRAALLLTLASAFAAQRSLHLPIGDPARKDRAVKVVLDAVTETSTGELLTPQETVSRLAGTRLIFIGEQHTSMDFHRVQLKLIARFQETGKKVLIGLEMYPYTEQKYLDDWGRGYLTESGFLQLSRWYLNWGYNWNYYRDIFLFARDHGISMFALNAPRDVVSLVGRKGLKNLAPEERALIAPGIDTASEEHFTLFKSFFEDDSGMHSMMSDSQARSMFEAQCTWDATMGYRAVQALKEHGDENSVMVVLIGSGHVAYGLGIQRQAAQWYGGKTAGIIPMPVADDRRRAVENVQASYADFVWGLPPESDPEYPDLGVATSEVPDEGHRRVLSVAEGSPGGAAGFQTGDILLSMDGAALDGETLNRLMAGKSWGDEAVFVVRRQAKDGTSREVTIKVLFRRQESRHPAR